ncbi:MAG: GAF domain-containing protein, partial [Anaerolineales bacterium]|nr:GAF domain-containing protein [Anaerolineales bacterium]
MQSTGTISLLSGAFAPSDPMETAAFAAAVLLLCTLVILGAWLLYMRRGPAAARQPIVAPTPRPLIAFAEQQRSESWGARSSASGISERGSPIKERSIESLQRRLSIMERLGQLLMEARDSSDVREQIVLAFVDELGCERGSLWELGREGDYFLAQSEVRAPDDPGGSFLGRQVTLPGEPLLAELEGRSEPLMISEQRTEALGRLLGERTMASFQPRSLMMVPLRQFNRLIGFLMVDKPEGRAAFDQADVEVAQSAARFAALVLENLRNRIEDQERGGRMTALAKLAATLTTRHRLEDVLSEIVEQGRALARSTTCTVLLVEEDETLRLAAQVGLGEFNSDLRLPLSNPTVASFIRRDAPLLVEDVDRDMPQLRNLLVREDVKAIQVFPLRVDHSVIGVLTLSYAKR